jgi:hypothetical protein
VAWLPADTSPAEMATSKAPIRAATIIVLGPIDQSSQSAPGNLADRLGFGYICQMTCPAKIVSSHSFFLFRRMSHTPLLWRCRCSASDCRRFSAALKNAPPRLLAIAVSVVGWFSVSMHHSISCRRLGPHAPSLRLVRPGTLPLPTSRITRRLPPTALAEAIVLAERVCRFWLAT